MGAEKVEQEKNKAEEEEAVEKPAAVEVERGEKKEDAAPNVVVLKLDLHCEGCAMKVRRAVSNFEGVEKAKTDVAANKLIVTGNVDPALLREKVESKTKKVVDLISPPPIRKGEKKSDQKTEEKKAEKPKQPVTATAVLKIKLHCEGCAHKIKRTILKNSKGVESVKTDMENNIVTLTGTMDVKELASFLQEKLKRSVEVVPPPKILGGGGDGGEKKDKEKEGGGGDKKGKEQKGVSGAEKKSGGGGGGSKAEVYKMDHASFNPYTHYAMPMYAPLPHASNRGYFIGDNYPVYSSHGYPLHGPSFPPPPQPATTYLSNLDDRMFSDENPNACSIM